MNLLVIANDPLRRAILSESLSMLGHTVKLARDNAEALNLLERSEVDLVISGTEKPATEPLQLHRTMRQQGRFSRLPFVQYGDFRKGQEQEFMVDRKVDFLLKRSDPLRLLVDVIRAEEEKRSRGLG